ncbi:MAG: hypothetical protein J7M15_05065 [Anaerolineae bacterium]|nr:hypothetical protein [Anaerolineae bacterium]
MKSKTTVLRTLLVIAISIGFFALWDSDGLATTRAASPADTGETAEPLQDVKTAYIVVRFANHDTIVRPVTFTGTISALDALEATDLAYTTKDTGSGPFLCSIEEVGDSTPACDNGDRYWATYLWDGDAWQSRMVGIADVEITDDGHVEGFSWSDPDWVAVDPAPAPPLVAAQRGLDWLLQQKQEDGGYGSLGNTAEVLIALGANRQEPEPATVANMLLTGRDLAGDAVGAGKLALGLSSHDTCWPHDAGHPLDYFEVDTGSFAAGAAPHAFAMLGTAALSHTIPSSAITYLLDQQQSDGGWEWSAGWGTDTNSTALAMQALVAAGEPVTSAAIISATNYLAEAQNDDGGFPYSPTSEWGTESDSNSTAYVVQALLAVGEDPYTGTWVISGTNPIDYLLQMQLEDGSFEWQPGFGANQSATQQVIPALLFRPFPVHKSELEACAPMYLPRSGGTDRGMLPDVTTSRRDARPRTPSSKIWLCVSAPDGLCLARAAHRKPWLAADTIWTR